MARASARRVEHLIKRTQPVQYARHDFGRDAPDRVTGHVVGANGRLRGKLSLGPTGALHAKNSSLRPADGYAKWKVMPTDQTAPGPAADDAARPRAAGKRPLTPAAERALAEAAARRAEQAAKQPAAEPELAGRGGPEPTRYGDWEINGLISDF
jgi:hypothetical protein